jgi:hypothetical protein
MKSKRGNSVAVTERRFDVVCGPFSAPFDSFGGYFFHFQALESFKTVDAGLFCSFVAPVRNCFESAFLAGKNVPGLSSRSSLKVSSLAYLSVMGSQPLLFARLLKPLKQESILFETFPCLLPLASSHFLMIVALLLWYKIRASP